MDPDRLLKKIYEIMDQESEFEHRNLQGLTAPGRPISQPGDEEEEETIPPIYHNGTHILVNETYAYPIPDGTNFTEGNYTYVWTPNYASIELGECEGCKCCIKGECRPANECTNIEDSVLIICGVLLGVFVALGVLACWWYQKQEQKRMKEHPELYQRKQNVDEEQSESNVKENASQNQLNNYQQDPLAILASEAAKQNRNEDSEESKSNNSVEDESGEEELYGVEDHQEDFDIYGMGGQGSAFAKTGVSGMNRFVDGGLKGMNDDQEEENIPSIPLDAQPQQSIDISRPKSAIKRKDTFEEEKEKLEKKGTQNLGKKPKGVHVTRQVEVGLELPVGANALSSSESGDEQFQRNPDDPMGIMNQGEDIEEIEVKASVHVNKSTIFKPEFTGTYAQQQQNEQNLVNDTENDGGVQVQEVPDVQNSYREELEGSPDPLNKMSFRPEPAEEKVKEMFYAQKDPHADISEIQQNSAAQELSQLPEIEERKADPEEIQKMDADEAEQQQETFENADGSSPAKKKKIVKKVVRRKKKPETVILDDDQFD